MRIVDIAQGNPQNRLNMRGRVLLIGQRCLMLSLFCLLIAYNKLQLCCFEQIFDCFASPSFYHAKRPHTKTTLNTTLSLHSLRANKAAHVKHGNALLYYSHVKPL